MVKINGLFSEFRKLYILLIALFWALNRVQGRQITESLATRSIERVGISNNEYGNIVYSINYKREGDAELKMESEVKQ